MERTSSSNVRRKINEKRLKKRRRQLIFFSTLLGIGLILGVRWVFDEESNTTSLNTNVSYKMQETIYKMSLNSENKNNFFNFNDEDFYYVTKDTVAMYDSLLNKKWENIHDFINVESYQKKDKLIVYDAGSSKRIYVYGVKGNLYTITPTFTVKKAKVNEDGYSVVVYDDNGTYHIYVYDNVGQVILSRIEDNMALLDLDISSDNKYLVISSLDLMSMNIKSNVIFQYLEEEDSIKYNAVDGTFSWFAVEEEIVGRVNFIDEYVYLVSDKKMQKIKVDKNSITEYATIDFTNVINDLIIVNDKYIVISMGYEDINKNGYKENSVVVFDNKGDEISVVEFDKMPSYIKSGINGFIVNLDNKIINYNLNGDELWTFDNGLMFNDFLLLGSNDKALAVSNKDAIIISKQRAIENVTDSIEAVPTEEQEEMEN